MECCQQIDSPIFFRDRVVKLTPDDRTSNETLRSEDFRISVDHPKLSKEDSLETRHLKELLLLHIDLLQQQQELIVSRDRQIVALQQDKETLLLRLERMERRLSNMKTKEVFDSPADNMSRKRKSEGDKQIIADGHVDDKSSSSHLQNDTEIASEKPCALNTDMSFNKFHEKKYPGAEVWVKSNCTDEKGWRVQLKKLMSRQHHGKKEDVMRTDTPYFVQNYDWQNEDFPETSSTTCSGSKKEEIPVPCWRLHHIPTGYQMEGTENLGDEIYAGRHEKPELDEKRRKRWDLQRIRELRLYQEKQAASEVNENNVTSTISLTVDIENLQSIEICDQIPVQAFGCPLPVLNQSEFSLNWSPSAKHRKQLEKSKGTYQKKKK